MNSKTRLMTEHNTAENNNSGACLELRDDPDGRRYYLEGKPVHNGDTLEVKSFDGGWRRGLYQWTRFPKEDPELWYWSDDLLSSITAITLSERHHVRWSSEECDWISKILSPGSLNTTEGILHQLSEPNSATSKVRDFGAPSDMRKALCQFQLLRKTRD
jgi:hypothetical protein